MNHSQLYGLLAEYDSPEDLLIAARKAREAGYVRLDAFTPFPVEGLSEAVGFRKTRLPLVVLIGGILGASGGYFLQYYSRVIAYPLDIGGRPLHSWPAFIPVTFELAILFAALAAVLGMLALNRLPMPYHPLFNVTRFELASRSHFFLCIKAADPKFDPVQTRQFLESLKPRGVYAVED